MTGTGGGEKRPFDIDEALEMIEEAVRPWPKAALFALAELGFDSPFEQLVACMISIRTRDETTLPVANSANRLSRPASALAPMPGRRGIDACGEGSIPATRSAAKLAFFLLMILPF